MLIQRIVNLFSVLQYPVDLVTLIGNVESILQEYRVSDVPMNDALIRQAILDSLDILEGNEYDVDKMLLEGLHDEYGFHDYDRVEEAISRNKTDQGYGIQ